MRDSRAREISCTSFGRRPEARSCTCRRCCAIAVALSIPSMWRARRVRAEHADIGNHCAIRLRRQQGLPSPARLPGRPCPSSLMRSVGDAGRYARKPRGGARSRSPARPLHSGARGCEPPVQSARVVPIGTASPWMGVRTVRWTTVRLQGDRRRRFRTETRESDAGDLA